MAQEAKICWAGSSEKKQKQIYCPAYHWEKVEVKRNRPSVSLVSNITNTSGMKLQDLIRISQDQESSEAYCMVFLCSGQY